MSCWIDYNSKYLKNLVVQTDSERQTVAVFIRAAIEYIEKFCGRTFGRDEFDEIHTVQDDCIILDNTPVVQVTRVAVDTGDWLTVQNTTAQIATLTTTSTGVRLRSVALGVATDTYLTYAAYPTFTTLSSAINALVDDDDASLGWVASVESGYGDYPSSDLVQSQFINAKEAATLKTWVDWEEDLSFDPDTGIIETNLSGNVRVSYLGGFDEVPEPLKLVCGNLVSIGFEGVGKQIKQETLGSYSYTIQDQDKLAISDMKILNLYKNRKV